VIITYAVYFTGKIGSIKFFYPFGRYSCVNSVRKQFRILCNYSTCCNNYIAMDNTIIHYNCTHSNKNVIVNGTTMNNSIMPYRNIISYHRWVFLIRTMNYCTILHIYLITHFNKMHITAYYCIIPNAALFSHFYISNYCGIFCYKATFGILGLFSVYFFNYRNRLFIKKRLIKIRGGYVVCKICYLKSASETPSLIFTSDTFNSNDIPGPKGKDVA